MASVHSSRASKCARQGLLEDDAPKHIPSAGELLIKQMARKQTDTNISLEEQLKHEKKFEKGVGCVMIGELLPGTSSLREFEEKQLKAERIKELESQGLTRGEAEVVLSNTRHSKASPAALAASQLHLQESLQSKLNHRCEGSVSRREWELAASVKPNSLETQLYKFAMQNSGASTETALEPPGHPIHDLAAMEHSLSQIASADPQKLAKTVIRKRRQQLEAMAEPVNVHYKPSNSHSSQWDCIEPPVIVPKQPPKPTRVATCRRQTIYTIKDGHIVPLDQTDVGKNKNIENSKESIGGQSFVALELPKHEFKVSGRLTEEEIKQLPRFGNYERGVVSKILYIKNLSNSVTEEDLVAVFAKFQKENEEKITFRLMNGKMRGQAFVKFQNCEVASKAIEEINGIVLRGKPMVIQYGRHQTWT